MLVKKQKLCEQHEGRKMKGRKRLRIFSLIYIVERKKESEICDLIKGDKLFFAKIQRRTVSYCSLFACHVVCSNEK